MSPVAIVIGFVSRLRAGTKCTLTWHYARTLNYLSGERSLVKDPLAVPFLGGEIIFSITPPDELLRDRDTIELAELLHDLGKDYLTNTISPLLGHECSKLRRREPFMLTLRSLEIKLPDGATLIVSVNINLSRSLARDRAQELIDSQLFDPLHREADQEISSTKSTVLRGLGFDPPGVLIAAA